MQTQQAGALQVQVGASLKASEKVQALQHSLSSGLRDLEEQGRRSAEEAQRRWQGLEEQVRQCSGVLFSCRELWGPERMCRGCSTPCHWELEEQGRKSAEEAQRRWQGLGGAGEALSWG